MQAGNVDSDRITVRNSDIYANTQDGLSFAAGNDDLRVLGNRIQGNGQRGLDVSGARALIQGNEVFGNANYGIYVNYSGTLDNRIVVRENIVRNNTSHGIVAGREAWVVGNDIFGHTNTNIYGVVGSSSNVLVEGNDIHDNYHGVSAGYGTVVRGNEIYGNSQHGVNVNAQSSEGGDILGNRIYGNSIGIVDGGYAHIDNNVIYANTNVGIYLDWRHLANDFISNNTIYQPVGDAIRLVSGAQDVRLFNNILWVAAGYGINANPAGLTGLLSDYNLIHTASAAARTGLWSNVERVTLADWQSASTRDTHSVSGAPLFLDIDGADNVLGATPATEGSGHDDNFGLRADSPAIDAAYAYHAPRYDIEGRNRHDDPSTANTGDGWPLYEVDDSVGNLFVAGGTARPYQSNQASFNLELGFGFNFYGATYTSVAVSTEGYLKFSGPDNANSAQSLEVFQRNAVIAPFWDNLTTFGTGRNIFIDTTTPDQITIRWAAASQADTSRAANFSVTLIADGRFRFDYGAGNSGLAPRVGVSAGNGFSFVLASGYDGSANLASANSLSWQAQEGLTFYDIGAYEFQGDSNDTTPPQVVVDSITQLPPNGGSTALAFSSIQIGFSESLDGISARSPANYQLLFAGADGVLDTLDDVQIGLDPAYSFPETDLTLQFAGGVLADGLYRLRLSGTLAIYDTAGNPLDGDANGSAGGDYLHLFTIDRSNNTDPVADAQAVNLNEDGSILITLSGSDADGDALVFGLFSNPVHGVLSGFDPVARTVTYTPDPDDWGSDSFQFQVDDGKLGTATATVSLNVLPVNDAPQAPGQVVNLTEDNPVLIVLQAGNIETPRSGLVFTLVTPPTQGALVQGANGSWTYTPDPDFFGDDSFTYTVTDRGGNDASPATALTSALGTITLIVNPTNDPPALDGVADREVNEGSLITIQLVGQDPENQSLNYSLVSGPAGATVDAASGLFSWMALDGDASVAVTVRVSDGVHPVPQSFSVTVHNVAPTLGMSGDPEVALGEVYQLGLSTSDPGADTVASWDINWGDGNVETIAGGATSASHTYALDGPYTITAVATDEDGSYDAAPVLVTVLAANLDPVAPGQFVETDEDQPLVITLAAIDPDGDTLTYSIISNPAFGTLGALDPVTHQLTYTPDPDHVGQVKFMFRVVDGQGGSATASIDIKVLPVNDAPVAADDDFAVHAGQTLVVAAPGLLGNDIDVDGNTLQFVNIDMTGLQGTVTVSADGGLTFTPSAGFVGQTTFGYTVDDGAGGSAQATVTIDVGNQSPVLDAIANSTVVAGDVLSLTLVANDPDLVDSLSFGLLDGPAGAQLDNSSGVLTWTAPYLNAQAVYTFTVGVSDGLGGADQQSFDVTVDPDLLRVSGVTWTSTGYQLRFNRAFDASTLNLFDGQGANRGAADMVLLDASSKPVAGSIVVDADAMGLTFVKTGAPTGNGLLSAGAHNLTLDSRLDAFVDTHGRMLDGDNNGVAGGGFSASLNQSGAATAFVSLGEFSRGAGQSVNLPASGAGIAVRIGNAAGASSVSFTLHYDADLLDMTGALSNLPAVTVTTDLSVAGQIGITVTGISGLTGATTELVHLTATVPASALARYGQSHVLDLRDVSINGGAMPVRDDDGLHVAAYLGDATGDGAYTSEDSQAVLDTISRKYTGFGAYPLADPVVVAGAFGNGRLSVFDVRFIGNMIHGVAQPYIPALPVLPAFAVVDDAVAGSLQAAFAEAVESAVPVPMVESPMPAAAPALTSVTAPVPVLISRPAPAVVVAYADATQPLANEAAIGLAPVAALLAVATPEAAVLVPGLATVTNNLDLTHYQSILDFDLAVTSLSEPLVARQPATGPDPLAFAPDPLASAVQRDGRDGRDRDSRVSASSELRVRFDRRARLIDADAGETRQHAWLQNWVSGRDPHVARKNADWRVVLPRS